MFYNRKTWLNRSLVICGLLSWFIFIGGVGVGNAGNSQQTNPPAAIPNTNTPTGRQADTRDPLTIALEHVRSQANSFGVTDTDLAELVITDQYTSQHNGVTHIYFQQVVNDLPIVNSLSNINILPDGHVLNVGDRMVADTQRRATPNTPAITAIKAVEEAANHLELTIIDPLTTQESLGGVNQKAVLSDGGISFDPIPAELVYLDHKEELRLTWQLVIYQLDSLHWWQLWVDAETGEILHKVNWVADSDAHEPAPHPKSQADGDPQPPPTNQQTIQPIDQPLSSPTVFTPTNTYRVVPFPHESPYETEEQTKAIHELHNSPADAIASPFGWHDSNGVAGAEFTNTAGNNVQAQDDLDANNTGGFRPNGGSDLYFDFPYDFTQSPTSGTNQSALITNLFYWNNIAHDVLYQYGFNEVSGNFQFNNYGNGGLGGDFVNADASDGSGTNNANFGTPADGSSPRMQMYQYLPRPRIVTNSPASLAAEFRAGDLLGPALSEVGVTGNVVIGIDGTAPTNDGCQALTNSAAINGNIALIDLVVPLNCSQATTILNAQNAGAIGVIIVNDIDSIYTPPANNPSITIPAVQTPLFGGTVLKNAVNSGTVNVTLKENSVARDSDFDNEIIIHEYGHGVSNRLTGGPSNVFCLQNQEQMGEGWSDFLGIVLTASENGTGGEARGRGSYANQQGPFGPGNRHYPYSTNTTINPNVYSTIATTNVPHGVGEVWASMLWEMYWNFVDRYGYNPDLYQDWESGGNNLALQLVLDGMKLQPCSPGFVDGRDAILAADVALTGGVNQCAIWEGFAKRGLGLSALQGSSASATDGSEAFNVPSSCRYVTRLDDPTPNGCSVGDCSLREAILAANNNAGIDTIQFTVDGTFNIEISGTGENAAATGDFDITDDLVIWGNGAGKTFIDGNGLDRVFEVHGDEVHFRRLTIQDGFVDAGAGFSSGAGIRNSGGNVTLQDVIVQFNSVVESGGTAVGAGISNLFSTAQMSLDRVSVIRNEAQGRAGIYNQDAVMTIENSTISSNSTSTSTGAGIYNYAFGVGSAEMTIRHTTIATNEGPAGFAALHNQNGSGTAVLTIEKSIIADAYTGLNCSNNGGLWTSEGYNLDDDGSCNLTEPTDQSSTVVKLLGRGTSASDLPTHVLAYDSPARDIIPAQNRYHPERDQNGTSRALGTLSDAGAVEAMPCRHDAYGYEMCLVLEAFTELTGGTILTLGDDDFTQVSLPFQFTFYGETHTALFVGSNGYITFGSGSTSRFETEFPNPGTPNNMIAGWWEDLNPNEGASEISYGTAGGGEFVVQFKNLEHYNGGNASTFQIILFPDNHAEVRYEFMSTDFETHSAGIENQGGDIGLSFHYDTRAIPFGTTVRYTPPDYAYLASAFQKVFFLDENLNPVRNFATLDDNVGGITTDGSYIYVAESDTQTIDVFDYAGILINQIAVPINSNFYRGLEFVEGELAVLTNGGYIQFHDPSSGRLLRTIPAQALVSGGIAFDGQLLWQLSGSGLVGTNPADGSVVSTIPNPLTNCPLSGQALTADAYGVLTMGCVSGQWYRLMSSDGTILAQGLNNVSMYGLKRIPHAHHQPDWNAPTDTALTLESSYTDTITITIQNENAGNLLWNLVEGNANLQNFGDETRLIERQNHPLLSPNGFAELPSHILLTPDLGIQAFGTELINDFFAMFDVGSAETLTNLSAFSDSVWAGDFGLGDHSFTYGINSTTGQLVKIDVSNGTITNVGAISAQAGHFWSGMATDPTTGIIYASSYNYPANTASYLYTINTSTGAATVIGNIYGAGGVIAIAFDNDGQLYGIDVAKDVLARIDKSTAKSETVGDLNYDANLAQGMDYDPVTETMYIAAYVNVQGGEWRTVNLETGLTALISDIGSSDPGGNNQFGWLAVQPPTITCTSSDIPWASVMGAANGLILPENSGDVLVEIDARTLNAGAYSGTLCFNTNDPDEPSVEYTINLTVTCDDLPIAPTDLTIQHGGSDILLDWTGGGADDYIIYRANIPYFIPSAFYGIDISVPTSYTDVGAGNAGNNYYYKIGGYKNCSNLGANSTDHVGKFEFGIVAGTP